ncbi:uncharacterized protein LOC106666981 isoform X2 [Cimex lectularius]|uniref:Regulatory protein zeste n=1 Tax=Cimex lectularius TaxID=79782 RepID=A0A8I6SNQ4_CIMLE|nr:uncharacterized protein LOC106666981 isoform X2 [Cimex lectularius]
MSLRKKKPNNYSALHTGVRRTPKITMIQKRILIEYMEKHPELINNTRKSSCVAQDGPDYTHLWEEVMDLLERNSTKPTNKEIDKWKKTWSDLKRHVELKSARIRANLISPNFTEFEARILKLMTCKGEHPIKEECMENNVSMDSDSWTGEDNEQPIPTCSSATKEEGEEDDEEDIKPNIYLLGSNGVPERDPLYIPPSDTQGRHLRPHKTINYAKMVNHDLQRVPSFKYSDVFIKNVHPSQRKNLAMQPPPQIKKRKVGGPTQKIINVLSEIKALEEKRYQEQQELTNKIAKAVETLATGLLQTIRNLSETAKRNAETIEELSAKLKRTE